MENRNNNFPVQLCVLAVEWDVKRASCAKCWSNIHIRIRILFVPHSEQVDNLIVQSGLAAREGATKAWGRSFQLFVIFGQPHARKSWEIEREFAYMLN